MRKSTSILSPHIMHGTSKRLLNSRVDTVSAFFGAPSIALQTGDWLRPYVAGLTRHVIYHTAVIVFLVFGADETSLECLCWSHGCTDVVPNFENLLDFSKSL